MLQESRLVIYTDGGARGNPGPAAVAAIISHPSATPSLGLAEEFHSFGEHIGKATNNEAEYRAVLLALTKIKQLLGKQKARQANLLINVDSELLYKQIKGEYKIKEERLQRLFIQIWNLKQDFGKVAFNLVPREQNKEADKIVNQVLDKKLSTGRVLTANNGMLY